MAYFIIAVDEATAEQRDAISEYLGGLGGYWHWMPDFWLANTNEEKTQIVVRDVIHKKCPSLVCIVLKVDVPDSTSWAGAFPKGQSKKWAEWLKSHWKPGV